MARAAGIDPSDLVRFEKGQRQMTATQLVAISGAIDRTADPIELAAAFLRG